VTKTRLSDVGRDMTPAELLTAYQCSELENSNLRRILLWAAQYLGYYERAELRTKINANLASGGVTVDPSEDDAIKNREFLNLVDSIVTSHEKMLISNIISTNSAHMIRLCGEAKIKISALRRPSLAFNRIER
jgi:hypothetical protein